MPRKRQSIRKIANRLTTIEDLFKETIPEEYVVEAVHRWLRTLRDNRTKYVVLKSCADTLASRGCPHLSAAIMETAGQHFVNPLDPSDTRWLESMSFASSYWLQAGDFESRQASLLKAAGISLKVTNQRVLFADDTYRDNLSPLWDLASDLQRDGQYGQSAVTYDSLASDLALASDFEWATKATLMAAHSYAHAHDWSLSVERAKSAINLAIQLTDPTRLLADAHLVAGIGYIQNSPQPMVSEALRYLATSKDLYDELPELADDDRDRIHVWLGAAYAMQGELFLSDYYTNRLPSYLEQADRSYSLAIAYFEHMKKLPVHELGASCALLSIVCRELGDTSRADELAAKAMIYGFDLT